MLHIYWKKEKPQYRMECDRVRINLCTIKTAWSRYSADAIRAWKMFAALSKA